ncbi:MAG: hypothetical protein KDC46_03340 [Thermoleophilia bacterium]|nr:hypothetical protein [Thermoleophilia bacterium]
MSTAIAAGTSLPATTTSTQAQPAAGAAPTAPAADAAAATTAGGGTDAAAGAAALGEIPGSLAAILQQLVEVLTQLIQILQQQATAGGGPGAPGKPVQGDPGQSGGFSGQQGDPGQLGGVPMQQYTPGAVAQAKGTGQIAQLDLSYGAPLQKAVVTTTPAQKVVPPTVSPLTALPMHWFADAKGGHRAKATAMSGSIVTVLRDLAGGLCLALGTGTEETVQVDGKFMRFDAKGAFMKSGSVSVGSSASTTQSTNTTQAASNEPPVASGGSNTAPPAPVLGALPSELPAG